MTPEGAVKKMIKSQLKELGAYYYMPVSNGMGTPGLDFYCCYRGRFFAIEAKAPGKHPTARQYITIGDILKSGGVSFVVDGDIAMCTVVTWLAEQALKGEFI